MNIIRKGVLALNNKSILSDNNNYIIICTKDEYNKIKECVKAMYDLASKAPKKFRTPNFYLLENIYNTKFKSIN